MTKLKAIIEHLPLTPIEEIRGELQARSDEELKDWLVVDHCRIVCERTKITDLLRIVNVKTKDSMWIIVYDDKDISKQTMPALLELERCVRELRDAANHIEAVIAKVTSLC